MANVVTIQISTTCHAQNLHMCRSGTGVGGGGGGGGGGGSGRDRSVTCTELLFEINIGNT